MSFWVRTELISVVVPKRFLGLAPTAVFLTEYDTRPTAGTVTTKCNCNNFTNNNYNYKIRCTLYTVELISSLETQNGST
jgi:hypothetical protein